jgi:hypothetical protein
MLNHSGKKSGYYRIYETQALVWGELMTIQNKQKLGRIQPSKGLQRDVVYLG